MSGLIGEVPIFVKVLPKRLDFQGLGPKIKVVLNRLRGRPAPSAARCIWLGLIAREYEKMKFYTFVAALLALCSWSFVVSGKAMAHGGTTFAVLDCEDEDGDESGRTFDCEDEDNGDAELAVLDCEDEDCDSAERTFDCEDEDNGDSQRVAVLDCHDDDEDCGDQS